MRTDIDIHTQPTEVVKGLLKIPQLFQASMKIIQTLNLAFLLRTHLVEVLVFMLATCLISDLGLPWGQQNVPST